MTGHTGPPSSVKLNSDEPLKGKVRDSLATSQQIDRLFPNLWYEYYLMKSSYIQISQAGDGRGINPHTRHIARHVFMLPDCYPQQTGSYRTGSAKLLQEERGLFRMTGTIHLIKTKSKAWSPVKVKANAVHSQGPEVRMFL